MALKKRDFVRERKIGAADFAYPASGEELKMVLRYEGTSLPPLEVGRPPKVKFGAPVSTKLGPAHFAIMDRLIATKVLGPGIGSKSDLLRAAVHWYLGHVVQLLKVHQLELIWAQMESLKQQYYTLKKFREVRETATMSRLTAKHYIEIGRFDQARLVLWEARRLLARLDVETDQAEFDARICGAGADEKVRPVGWKEDVVAQRWDLVLAEEVTPEGDLLEEDFVDATMAEALDGYNVPDPEEKEE